MNLALDTNRYSDLARGVADVVSRVTSATTLHLPLPVLAELYAGFFVGTRAAENERTLNAFLAQPNVSIVSPDRETARQCALIYAHLRRRGTPIPVNDMWIAALCIQHNLTLYERDAHFALIPGLQRVE